MRPRRSEIENTGNERLIFTRPLGLSQPARRVWAAGAFRVGIALGALLMLVRVEGTAQAALYAALIVLLCVSSVLADDALVIDAVEVLLSVRIAWLAVVGVSSAPKEWLTGFFVAAVVALVSYSSARRCSRLMGAQRYLRLVLAVTFVVMLIQVMVASAGHAGIADFGIRKYYIDIPFGNSNAIAMIMSTIGLYLAWGALTDRARLTWASLLALSAVLLSSVGNYLVLTGFALAGLVRRLKQAKIGAGTVGVGFIALSIVMVIAVFNWRGAAEAAGTAFSEVAVKATALQAGDLDATTTNRTKVFLYYIGQIAQRPLIGYGTRPVVGAWNQPDAMRPHNLVLEALYQGGPINLLLYLGACLVAFRGLEKTDAGGAIRVAALFLFLYSMIEPGLFAANQDFVFWTMLGAGTAVSGGEIRDEAGHRDSQLQLHYGHD